MADAKRIRHHVHLFLVLDLNPSNLELYATNVHDAHDVAVFLAEQRHGTSRVRVLVRTLTCLDLEVLPHMRIYVGFDGSELLAFDRTVVTNVDAQPFGRDHRPRLTHVRS